MSLRRFLGEFTSIPATVGWYLADLGEFKGRQEMFTRQAPQKLHALRQHALVESTVSSNRIEGVEIDQSRINTVVFGSPHLRDRDEEEVRGYRQALSWIHDDSDKIPITEKTVLNLHRLVRGDIWDAGAYKEKDGEIVQRYPDGRSRVRFRPVSACDTLDQMEKLVSLYDEAARSRAIPPPVLLAAWNLDFLCIHPFRDGKGRGNKTELVLQAIAKANQSFSISEIRDKCPEVSLEMIRRILKRLRDDKRIQSIGRGRNARWRKTGNW